MNKKITALCLAIIMLFSCINFVWAGDENVTNNSTDEIVIDEAVSDSSISISEADISVEEDVSLADDDTDNTTVRRFIGFKLKALY